MPSNAPSGTAAYLYNCMITVRKQGTTNRYVQEFYTLNGNTKYIRHCGLASADTWSSWIKAFWFNDIKTKEVTGITSANGNLSFELSGKTCVVLAAQAYNSSGYMNDTIIIPYKYGDDVPTESVQNGRWGGHFISSSSAHAVKASQTVYATIFYIEYNH